MQTWNTRGRQLSALLVVAAAFASSCVLTLEGTTYVVDDNVAPDATVSGDAQTDGSNTVDAGVDVQGIEVGIGDGSTGDGEIEATVGDGFVGAPDAVDRVVPFDVTTGVDGFVEGGRPEGGMSEAGVPDSGLPETGVSDAGLRDAGLPDVGLADVGMVEVGLPEVGAPDGVTGMEASVDDAGACSSPCTGSSVCCGSTCVDLSMSSTNCGLCGNVCPTGAACNAGHCMCTGINVLCGATACCASSLCVGGLCL